MKRPEGFIGREENTWLQARLYWSEILCCTKLLFLYLYIWTQPDHTYRVRNVATCLHSTTKYCTGVKVIQGNSNLGLLYSTRKLCWIFWLRL